MPTRQEILEGLRSLSEEVIESLRVLFFMIFSLTKAINPNENMSDQDVTPIQQLVNEVKTQRMKITELGNLITQKFPDPPTRSSGPTSPIQEPEIGSDPWELAEMEEEEFIPPSSCAGMMPNTSPPRALIKAPTTAATSSPGSPMRIAGMPLTGRPATVMPKPAPMPADPGNQIALTQQALHSWGQKVINWGKKHPGKTFQTVYETDNSYVRWVLARMGNMNEEMEDFGNYALTRQRLEAAALNANQ